MKIRSYAKINLHLQLVGRRPDGYHELRTVFQTIDLADELEVEVGGGATVRLEVEGDAPSGPENLAARAAEAFRSSFAPDLGVSLRLVKRIPTGGGLGGGSSNAASVLRALRLATGLGDDAGLWGLARELGADVPFFLFGGTALGVGRGDEVVPLPELEPRDVWLVLPSFSVPTPAAFADVKELTGEPLEPKISTLAQGGELTWDVARFGRNDLELTVFERYPELRLVAERLRAAGAVVARLSGSGSTIFALFEERVDVPALETSLPAGCRLVRSRTVTRDAL